MQLAYDKNMNNDVSNYLGQKWSNSGNVSKMKNCISWID